MLITRSHRLRPARRGIILLVVLALLTLFAIVGIAFVLVANSQETSARIAREAETQTVPEFNGELALSMYLGQLIYDVNDDATGVNSSIRGQSLARLMYGYNNGTNVLNDKAFSGTGRLHNTAGLTGLGPMGDEAYLVNFQYFPNAGDGIPQRNPEHPLINGAPGPYTGGANIPYTYPDHQNFFLAYQDAASGQILVPSFHREYLFGRLDDPSNPNWTNAAGKYLTARPRPSDVGSGFPMPGDRGGDVKNLDWAPGGNDSIWTDPGFPVMTNADGTKYKVLIAPLVIELDSRLNLNVAGNLVGNSATWPSYATNPNAVTNTTPVGSNSTHASNQGWGSWEVNPGWVLNADASSGPTGQEWKNILYGSSPTGQTHVLGRYGTVRVPGDPLAWLTTPRIWAAADFNGLDESTGTTTSTGYILPGPSWSQFATIPKFPSMRYGSGTNPQSPALLSESLQHPRYYNPMRSSPVPNPGAPVTGTDSRVLPVHAMHQLLRYGSTNGDYLTSDLLRLLPQNLNGAGSDGNGATRRNLVTVRSFDIDRPGVTPYLWDPSNATQPSTPYVMNTATIPYPQATTGIPFPQLSQRGGTPANSEFDQASWRSLVAALGRINLNRSLTPFPPPDATGVSTNASQALQALADRQQFASDIFTRLVQVTTGYTTPAAACNAAYQANLASTGGSTQYQALRYLAQLSANIVDYIDTDDQSTPFNWYNPQGGTPEWVFGTETPRLLINEGYIQYDNNAADPVNMPIKGIANWVAQKPYNVNVSIELFNPLLPDPYSNTSQDTTARLQTAPATGTPQNLYQVLLVNQAAAATGMTPPSPLLNPGNTIGDPNFLVANPAVGNNIYSTVNSFGSSTTPNTLTVPPLNPPAQAPTPTTAGQNNTVPQGFYVLGPQFTYLSGNVQPGNTVPYAANPNLPYTFLSSNMSYIPPSTTAATPPLAVNAPATTAANSPAISSPSLPPIVLLQRLACPLLPYNPTNTSSTYNPFITIDSFAFQTSQINDGRYYTATGSNTPTTMQNRSSWGRKQPFANISSQVVAQVNSNGTPSTTSAQNTFFSHNTTPTNPFLWNTHLDRQLISPIELLFVHGARPMDLTAQFVTATAPGSVNTARYAPWLDQASRLHRFLEIVETAPLTAGVAPWGRIPGRININGVWPSALNSPGQSDVWLAACDPQPGNVFKQSDAETVFTAMFNQRSPNVGVFSGSATNPLNSYSWYMPGPTDQQLVSAANGVFGSGYTGSIPLGNTVSSGQGWQLDRPFWGMATGFAGGTGNSATDAMAQSTPSLTSMRGLDNTLLRPLTVGATSMTNQRALGFSTTNTAKWPHPYQQVELLNKIYNSVTTRSNVFAVYLTVGFFQVTNDQTTPVQLGAEIGRLENRQVRHRMFAIVDRSNLTSFTTSSTGAIAAPVTPASPNPTVQPTQAIPIAANGTNANTGRTWALQAGMYLTFEPNTNNEETVLVQPGNVASFNLAQASGVQVINRGNPGPWMRYNPRLDGGVVPYFAIID